MNQIPNAADAVKHAKEIEAFKEMEALKAAKGDDDLTL